jgi:predicted RNase H-like nuclease
MDWIAGVDGCPDGWVVALEDLDSGDLTSGWGVTFALALALPQHPRVIAVDIPIGLLSAAQPGGRGCDREARKLLGKRGSSVFSARPGRLSML